MGFYFLFLNMIQKLIKYLEQYFHTDLDIFHIQFFYFFIFQRIKLHLLENWRTWLPKIILWKISLKNNFFLNGTNL